MKVPSHSQEINLVFPIQRDASEVPTFRAQFKEDLFKSTLMDDSSCSQATTQSDVSKHYYKFIRFFLKLKYHLSAPGDAHFPGSVPERPLQEHSAGRFMLYTNRDQSESNIVF